VDYEVTLEPHNRFGLFGLEMPAALPPNARLTGDLQVLSNTPIRARMRYQMRSYPAYHMQGGDADELRAALALPRQGNARARALARQWRASAGADDEAVIRQGIEFFRAAGYQYTLQPPLLERDTVDGFLFDTRQGFCEHFASSFTFLMRAAGVPARVVTGYQGGEINPVDGFLEVRQADAHAWSEVWLKDRGWMRVDPTAAAVPMRVDEGVNAAIPQSSLPLLMRENWSWLRSLRFNLSALTNQWNQWVLGYNPDRQREFLSRLGVPQPDWATLAHLLFWSVAAVMGLTSLWMLVRVRRRDPVQAAWLRFCARMARHGLPRAPEEGPLAYGERLAERFPARADGARRIAALYGELRYGRDHAPEDVARLRQWVTSFQP
jgi:transglutaminase-like putative cysteine protease